MQENLYSVLDTKTGVFCRPFTAINDQFALRDFAHAANDLSTNVGRYPTDFSLFRVGMFDFSTGFVVPESSPVCLGVAATLVKPRTVDDTPIFPEA